MPGTIYALPRGGFGNLLFVYLAAHALSRRYGMSLAFVRQYADKRQNMASYELFKDLTYVDRAPADSVPLKERAYEYSELTLSDPSRNYLLDGYFQSYLYSQPHLSEAKAMVRPLLEAAREEYRALVGSSAAVMLHVRRGDYLAIPNYHAVQTDEYYRASVEHIVERVGPVKLLVFSDDVEFLRSWPFLRSYEHEIVDRPVERSFALMTMCDHFVIANSTLSLLAYYLREKQDALLCMPKAWFGPAGPKYRHEHLVEMTPNVALF